MSEWVEVGVSEQSREEEVGVSEQSRAVEVGVLEQSRVEGSPPEQRRGAVEVGVSEQRRGAVEVGVSEQSGTAVDEGVSDTGGVVRGGDMGVSHSWFLSCLTMTVFSSPEESVMGEGTGKASSLEDSPVGEGTSKASSVVGVVGALLPLLLVLLAD